MVKLIGLIGRMGSGKNTLAEIIAKNNPSYYLESFASSLKEICEMLFGECTREYLQKLGAFARSIDKDIWINKLLYEINWAESMNKYWDDSWEGTYIITDVRHLNEADWIVDQDGILIIINTDSATRRLRIEDRDQKEISLKDWIRWAGHLSETEIVDIITRYSYIKCIFDNNENLSEESLTDKFLDWYEGNIK